MKSSIFNKTKNRRTNGVTTRQIVLTICCIAFACAGFAQDVIFTRDAKRIEAKVTEINVDNIRYRLFDNLEGPLYTMPKSDVVSITFQNGLTQTFATTTSVPAQPTPANTQTAPASTQTRTTSTQAMQTTQAPPAYNSYDRYAPGQRRLTTAETLHEMQINYPRLFSQYNAGRRMKSAGWALTGTGIGAFVLGIAIGVDGEERCDDQQIEAGAAITAVGIVLVATGIPILAVGAGQRRRALKAFNNQYYISERPASQFQLNVYPNRVGLAYVF